ncbi:unnamed protein product, partial [Polarella glacialis]
LGLWMEDAPAPAVPAPPAQTRLTRKRPPDDLSLLCELPPAEAEAVSLALEQWGRLRHRVKALEPTLRREGALVQEILDTGLRDENRRTLRKQAAKHFCLLQFVSLFRFICMFTLFGRNYVVLDHILSGAPCSCVISLPTMRLLWNVMLV